MHITIPKLSLVVLIGPSGSGKSTFARRHFLPTEVLSSDACRAMVSDDENDQAVTKDAFEVLHFIAAKRLALGRLTVIDATNVQPEARKPLVELARQYHCLPVAIVLEFARTALPGAQPSTGRTELRPSRRPPPAVATAAVAPWSRKGRLPPRLRAGNARRGRTAAVVERVPLWNDKRRRTRPVRHHRRCSRLLRRAGGAAATARLRRRPFWQTTILSGATVLTSIPQGRKAVFVGDLVDRGPRILDTVRLVRNMVYRGSAFCVPGNHDMKLMRKLRGKRRPDHARAGQHPRRDRRLARSNSGAVLQGSWPSSSTAW